MGAGELQKILGNEFKCKISYDVVYHGKNKASDILYGKWEESFALLFRWKAAVMEKIPDSVIEIDVCMQDDIFCFRRFFCALDPCISGFLEGCRPYLSVDSTSLNGRWNGQLAAATSVDGMN